MTTYTIRHTGAKRKRGGSFKGSSNARSKPYSSSSSRTSSGSSSTSSSSHRSGGGSRFSKSSSSSSRGGSSAGGYRSRGGSSGGFRGRSGSGNRSRSGGGQRSSGGRGGRKMPTFDPSQFINKNPAQLAPEVYKPKHTFATFGLDARIVETVHAIGIKDPSPIQDQIIPEILNGRDVVGLAETGTGKTAAFLLPSIEKTLKDTDRTTLIIAPTRELAIQIQDEVRKFTPKMNMYSTTCVGGMNIGPQISSLRKKNNFIIGTPGRILDLLKRKLMPTANIKTVVLDEADRMLDMGFIHDIRSILSMIPSERETLFFSATMNKDAENIVKDFLKNPITVSVKKRDVTNSIEQDIVTFEHHAKFEKLCSLLAQPEFKRVLIFGSMKHSVEKLSAELTAHGISADSIHGNKNHSQRQRALRDFKFGKTKVLVATDVAARGIHVEEVSHVINYDLPNTFDDYVHRIGRTGRGNNKGKALTFVQNR